MYVRPEVATPVLPLEAHVECTDYQLWLVVPVGRKQNESRDMERYACLCTKLGIYDDHD